MTKIRYQHSFNLNEKEEIDLITAQSRHSIASIIRMGIKEALKDCPKPPKKLLKKTEEIANMS